MVSNSSSRQSRGISCRSSSELIAEATQNPQAYGALYNNLRDFSQRIAYHYLRNHQDAEDVVQATWARLFTSLHQFRGSGKFSSWLGTIILNECRTLRKRANRFPSVSFDEEVTTTGRFRNQPSLFFESAEVEHQRRDMHRKLRHHLSRLPSVYRNVLTMSYVDRLSVAQIAQKLQISESAAKSRLVRARAELAARFR